MTDWKYINHQIFLLAEELKRMAKAKTDSKMEYKKVKELHVRDSLREQWDEDPETEELSEDQENRDHDYQSRHNDWKSEQRGMY